MDPIKLMLILGMYVQSVYTQYVPENLPQAIQVHRTVQYDIQNYVLFNREVIRCSKEYNLDPNLVRAVIIVESKFRPRAKSRAGAKGLMQLTNITIKHLELSSPHTPTENIEAGTRYLQALLKRFKTEKLALAAYNAGPTRVRRYGGIPPYIETRNYVSKVLKIKKDLS
jgi:soluble lytic murein transglycosylase-like protein